MVLKAVVAKTVGMTATILFAGLAAVWFGIKIQQSAGLGVPVWFQAFRVASAMVLFSPFLALLFLGTKPRLFFKENPWWGSLFFAGLAFLWLFFALFLSLVFGLGGF